MHGKTTIAIHAVGLLLAGLLSAMMLYGREIGERRNRKW